jgi:hypothetical protein
MREKVMDGSGGKRPRLWGLGVAVAGVMALATASSAGAAVTIGQLAPGTPPDICSNPAPFDMLQPTVTSGNSYVVPAMPPAGNLVISSWSNNAGPANGTMLKMKVFRKIGEPMNYQVVGHDGFRSIVPSRVNTFPVNIPVRPGDVLGANDGTVTNACAFAVPGETVFLNRSGDLADGGSAATWTNSPGNRLNLTAVVEPNNSFTLGKVKRNLNKGTATLTANVPNVGQLGGSGKGVKVASAGAVISKAVTPGSAKLVIRAKGKRKAKLNDTGKVKLKAKIRYTPTGGSTRTLTRKLKLKKNL